MSKYKQDNPLITISSKFEDKTFVFKTCATLLQIALKKKNI